MYILYLDESGAHSEASYFVLAGLAVFEREIHWYAQDVDALQRRYFPNIQEPIEFHASVLRQPQSERVAEPFDQLRREQRRGLLSDIYQIIRAHRGILFGVAIEKDWCINEEPYERALNMIASAAKNTVSIGDRYDVDIEIPRAMGMGGVLVEELADLRLLQEAFRTPNQDGGDLNS